MSLYKNSLELTQLTLGKITPYSEKYDANLLQGVARELNRKQINLNNNELPFVGEDVWYGYELSWLNKKGKPIVALAEFRIPCNSVNIIESKSFKLYLNSFNQTSFDNWQTVQDILQTDLSLITQSPVNVTLFSLDDCSALAITTDTALCIDDLDIDVEHYDITPQLLTIPSKHKTNSKWAPAKVSEYLVSHLVKSNCLITNQPDWASVYIQYSGEKIPHDNLLKYLISFRQHNEFHEHCVERIFCDLYHYCNIDELTVYARYTRRGGLDINPYRSTHSSIAPVLRTIRQ